MIIDGDTQELLDAWTVLAYETRYRGRTPKSNGTGASHSYTVSDGSSFGGVPEEGLCLLPNQARNFARFVTSIMWR
jgi:hypothetical protein